VQCLGLCHAEEGHQSVLTVKLQYNEGETGYAPGSGCSLPGDVDYDGIVDVNDLLALLSVFNVMC
jgi:hypothetical protein